MNDRLSDEKWRAMLDAGQAPELPAWTCSFFTPETGFTEFQRTIYSYQSDLSQVFWNLSVEYQPSLVSEAVRQQLGAEIAQLQADNEFIGHQWLGVTYRSFDRQSDALAVVTVRETWQDALYRFTDCPGDCVAEPQAPNQRGPYTLDVTYTLQADANSWTGWVVTNVVTANQPPEWGP